MSKASHRPREGEPVQRDEPGRLHRWRGEIFWCVMGLLLASAFSPVLSQPVDKVWNSLGVPTSEDPTVILEPPVCDSLGSRGPDQTVDLQVRRSDKECWQPEISPLEVGTHPFVLIGYANYTSHKVDDVLLKVELPEGISLVPNTSYIRNTLNPDGRLVSDNVATDGVNISNYEPKSNAYLMFRVAIDPSLFACGKSASPLEVTATSATDPDQLHASMDLNVWKFC